MYYSTYKFHYVFIYQFQNLSNINIALEEHDIFSYVLLHIFTTYIQPKI